MGTAKKKHMKNIDMRYIRLLSMPKRASDSQSSEMIAGPPMRKLEMEAVAVVILVRKLFKMTRPKLGPAPTKIGM
jgi:hypothetical protein